jgi:tetratricopeptide (TPR) repeat protein
MTITDTASPKYWRFAWVILLFSIFIIYSNSLHGDWQLDDPPNIVHNRPIQIDNLMPETLWQTFFAKPGHPGNLYRPIPCLTFALNWFLGQDDPAGYHIVNIGLHALSAILIYWVVLVLLQTPRLVSHKGPSSATVIALMAAVLWAVHPLQTQAVNYIVQRMAQLAAVFYLAGMLFYLKGRMAEDRRRRMWFFGGCALSFGLGILSKENAVMLPLALILLEISFLLEDNSRKKMTRILWIAAGVGLLSYALGVLLFLNGDFLFFLKSYGNRTFTPIQRLLTEARIVWFYLSQLVLPLPGRLSIDHDVVLSTSLLTPGTTLPAVIGHILAVGLSFYWLRKYPVPCFGVLFFYLNHVIESSIISLELVFEHRNYLPSVFLFLPVSMGLHYLFSKLARRQRALSVIAGAVACLMVLSLGYGTYQRNKAWQTVESLWLDALLKAPNSVRAMNTLAIRLAWGPNANSWTIDKALALFERSLPLPKTRDWLDADVLGNMASIYAHKGEEEKALGLYRKALAVSPDHLKIRSDLARHLVKSGAYSEALQEVQGLIEKDPQNPKYLNLAGFIHVWLDSPQKALPFFQQALKINPFDAGLLLNAGAALSQMNHHRNADWFFKRAIQMAPGDVWGYFFLIENLIETGNQGAVRTALIRMSTHFPVSAIFAALQEPARLRPPISRPAIQMFLSEHLRKAANQLQPG